MKIWKSLKLWKPSAQHPPTKVPETPQGLAVQYSSRQSGPYREHGNSHNATTAPPPRAVQGTAPVMRRKVNFRQRGMETIVCSALRPYGVGKGWGGGEKDWNPLSLGAVTYSDLITLMSSVKADWKKPRANVTCTWDRNRRHVLLDSCMRQRIGMSFMHLKKKELLEINSLVQCHAYCTALVCRPWLCRRLFCLYTLSYSAHRLPQELHLL